jgi:hypothetical protein
MEQLGSQWTDYDETLYLLLFRKSVEKIRMPLKSGKINGHFIRKGFDIFGGLTKFFLE